jgi:hypothetical protein
MALPIVTGRLSSELRRRWPTLSQGIYGDAAHGKRLSDHNRVTTSGKPGPRAIDVMTNSEDRHRDLVLLLLDEQFRDLFEISLIISRRRIWSPRHSWLMRPYTGSNPHLDHLHVSCDG